MPAVRSDAQSNPFIKQLASSDRTLRDRALASLRTFLHHATPFPPAVELLKLWKGLFYCMFMSDKPRNQQRLARDLAALVDVCSSRDDKLAFVRAFWHTLAREWGGIDSLRKDKYLYLVRCYVRKGFEVCAEGDWDEEVLEKYLSTLVDEGGPLSPRDMKVPVGLRLHVVDIWTDELEKVDGKRESPVETVMAPVRNLGKETLVKSVRKRVAECLDDERLKDWRNEGTANSGDDPEPMNEDDEQEKGQDDDFGGFDDD